MLLKSYAKINLSLLVNKKLRSGLHEIQSLFCLIDLSDKIEIQKVSKKKTRLSSKVFLPIMLKIQIIQLKFY